MKDHLQGILNSVKQVFIFVECAFYEIRPIPEGCGWGELGILSILLFSPLLFATAPDFTSQTLSKKKICPEIFFGGVSVTYFLLNILRSVVGQKDKRQNRVKFESFNCWCCLHLFVLTTMTMFELRKWSCFAVNELCRDLDQKFWSDLFLCVYNWGTLLIGKHKR